MFPRTVLLIIAFCSLVTIASADKITLNNGDVVQGTILRENTSVVQVDIGGTPKNYLRREIKNIERDQAQAGAAVPVQAAPVVTPPSPSKAELKQERSSDSPVVQVPSGTATPAETPVSEQLSKRELALRLLEANGTRDSMDRIFTKVIADAPDDSRESLKALLVTDKMIERIIPVYEKNYTETELKDLVTFYKSPTGQRHIKLAPQMMEETMKAVTLYIQEKVKDVGPGSELKPGS